MKAHVGPRTLSGPARTVTGMQLPRAEGDDSIRFVQSRPTDESGQLANANATESHEPPAPAEEDAPADPERVELPVDLAGPLTPEQVTALDPGAASPTDG